MAVSGGGSPIILRRSKAAQLLSSRPMRVMPALERSSGKRGRGRVIGSLGAAERPLGGDPGGAAIGRDDGQARIDADASGTGDRGLQGALRLAVEHIDEVALAAGFKRLAAHAEKDAGHLVGDRDRVV